MSEVPRLARRDHEGIGRADLVQAAIVERRGPIEHEAEHQLAMLAAERERFIIECPVQGVRSQRKGKLL